MRKILALLILLAIPAVAQFGGPMGGLRPGSMQGGGLLPGRGGDPLWVAAGPTKPKLDLDFAKRKDLTDAVSGKTSIVTFSRSAAQSPGTYVGADGLIHDAAVNLALYSEQFDNASWTTTSNTGSVTRSANQAVAPDGKQTADKLFFPAISSASHYGIIRQLISSTSGRTHTGSLWVKAARPEDVGKKISLYLNDGSFAFHLFTVGAEWERISGDELFDVAGVNFTIGVVGSSYGGENQDKLQIYLWGAQLEETDPATMEPTAYVHTTSQALAAPRFDHTPTTGNLTTNLLTYSEMLDVSGAWIGAASTVTANATTAPDGTLTADKIASTGSNGLIYQNAGNLITASSRYVTVSLTDGTYNIGGGTFSSINTENVGNGWWRISAAINTTPAYVASVYAKADDWAYIGVQVFHTGSETRLYFYPTNSASLPVSTGTGTEGVFVWGAQLEASPTAGTYVRTLSETRSISDAVAPSLGLLVEEQRANLVPYSEEFDNISWAKISGGGGTTPVVTANYAVAPDGTFTADRITGTITPTGSPDWSLVRKLITSTTGILTWSIWLKSNTGSNQIITIKYTGGASGIITVTPEWQRFLISATQASFECDIGLKNDGASVTDNSMDVLAWGAQLETGAFPSSYIPTVTSQTRYADIAAVQDEDFATTNLISYSESFDVGWSTTRLEPVTANATTAPDGTLTADYIEQQSGQATAGGVYQTVTVTSPFVASVYAKAAEKDFLYLLATGGGAYFDLQNGTVGTVFGANTQTLIENVGGGWYRCSIMGSYAFTGNLVYYPTDSDGTLSVTDSGGIYLWGASLTATEYPVEYTTTRNLLTDSQDFERSTWLLNYAAIQNDVALAPDGTLTADRLKEDANNNIHRVSKTTSVVGSKEYTASAYFKADERVFAGLYFSDTFSTFARGFDLSTGATEAISGTSSPTSWTITDVGNGWYRCTITATTNASAAIASWQLRMGSASGTYSYPGDNTSGMYVYGAQLEPGTTATDYVRTVDTVGKDYGWYEPTEGTVFVDAGVYRDLQNNIVGLDYNSTNTIAFGHRTGGYPPNQAVYWIRRSANSEYLASLPNTFADFNIAAAYKYNDANFAVNGTAATTDTSVLVPIPNRLSIGKYAAASQIMNGHIKRLTYWPTRQSDSTLQVITQ